MIDAIERTLAGGHFWSGGLLIFISVDIVCGGHGENTGVGPAFGLSLAPGKAYTSKSLGVYPSLMATSGIFYIFKRRCATGDPPEPKLDYYGVKDPFVLCGFSPASPDVDPPLHVDLARLQLLHISENAGK